MELTFTTAGESHGPGLVAIVEGLPAGLELEREALDRDMARRQLGHGRGGRMKIESDAVEIRSGVRHGRTLGSPIAVLVANRDYPNWDERMNPWPVDAEVEESHLPRPGHADLAGLHKFGFSDVRNVLERASARETAARVAAGSLAKGFLTRARRQRAQPRDPDRLASRAPQRDDLAPEDFAERGRVARCAASTPRPREAMVEEIDRLRKENESPGRQVRGARLRARARPRLLHLLARRSSTAAWRRPSARSSRSRASRLARAGTWPARPGSEAHDEIFHDDEQGWHRKTNRAGGLEGGMTNGEPLVVQAAIKPISTMTQPLRSVDTETKEPAQAMRERTDSTVVPAAGVVAEAMVALVLAGAYREKFGGDHIDDVHAAIAAYKERIGWRR